MSHKFTALALLPTASLCPSGLNASEVEVPSGCTRGWPCPLLIEEFVVEAVVELSDLAVEQVGRADACQSFVRAWSGVEAAVRAVVTVGAVVVEPVVAGGQVAEGVPAVGRQGDGCGAGAVAAGLEGWAAGFQWLKSPTTLTGPGGASSGRTKVTWVRPLILLRSSTVCLQPTGEGNRPILVRKPEGGGFPRRSRTRRSLGRWRRLQRPGRRQNAPPPLVHGPAWATAQRAEPLPRREPKAGMLNGIVLAGQAPYGSGGSVNRFRIRAEWRSRHASWFQPQA